MQTATLRTIDAPPISPATPLPVGRFHEIADAAAILCSKTGVYRQTKVFRRGRELYAGYGSGFIRLFKDGTSVPAVRLVEIDIGDALMITDSLGKLLLSEGSGE